MRGFTLVELLVVLGILALIAAIVTPAAVSARRRGQAAGCLSNLRQWNLAMSSYMQDYDGNYPQVATVTMVGDHSVGGGTGWYSALFPYTGDTLFTCPSRWVSSERSNRAYACGYAMNAELNELNGSNGKYVYSGKNEALVRVQSQVVTVFDVRPGIFSSDVPDVASGDEVIGNYIVAMESEIKTQTPGAVRHNGGANYGFADGHVRWLRPEALVRVCDETKPCFKP